MLLCEMISGKRTPSGSEQCVFSSGNKDNIRQKILYIKELKSMCCKGLERGEFTFS